MLAYRGQYFPAGTIQSYSVRDYNQGLAVTMELLKPGLAVVYELDLNKLSVKELSRAGRMITNPNKITFMFDPTKSKSGPPSQMYIQPVNGIPGTPSIQCLVT